eukprot:jgi/Mesvir1/8737/Mv02660-RA.1
MAASADLVWLLVRNNSKYLQKQWGKTTQKCQFTSEPFNLSGKNSFKYSGLANPKAVHISAAGAEKPSSVIVKTKKPKSANQPAKSVSAVTHTSSAVRVMRVVKNKLAKNRYRPDLTRAAMARVSAIHKSLRVIKAGVKKSK